ncbi:MAG: glycosyltransferase [Pirellula sp.]|jgi:cellulose synthase/poly-beta-1,6-N-acetylglucosamine synthase-like glycosyltransferase
MMLVSIVLAIFVISGLIQGLMVYGFVHRLNRWKEPLLEDSKCPRASIILCLRGSDPFLERCITGLRELDYPDFEVVLVVDSPSDPANDIVNKHLQEKWSNASRVFLENRLATCSLKCSSLLQGLSAASPASEIIALIDADTVPHKNWLRELASSLQPSDIGAVTGNRWYMPQKDSLGAWVRYVWNAAAVVQMYWYSIAWGGTVALKRTAIEQAGLQEKWGRSLCEDTMLCSQLAKVGLKVKFVPSLMMINREDCTLGGYYSWVKRQLLTARLYHPKWNAVLGHGISSAAFLIVAIVLLVFNVGVWLFAGHNAIDVLWLGLGLILFQLYLSFLLPVMERAVSGIVESRSECSQWPGKRSYLKLCGYVFITQWIYTVALIASTLTKRVEWRGIYYRLHGPWGIEREVYAVYAENEESSPSHSL